MSRTAGFGLVLIVSLLGLLACTTSSGSTYSQSVHREAASRTPPSVTATPVPNPPATGSFPPNIVWTTPAPPASALTIETIPSSASIFVDGWFRGNGQARIEATPWIPARISVTVQAPSHRPQTREFTVRNENRTVIIELEPILGRLILPPETGTEYRTLTQILHPGENSLLIGPQTIQIRHFGFRTEDRRVVIEENQATELQVNLTPLPFALGPLDISQGGIFNPAQEGPRSSLRLSFSAQAPGTAAISITSPLGILVQAWTFESLTWNQSQVWSGRQADGTPWPDGLYTVELTSSDRLWDRRRIQIDSSLHPTYRPSFSGAPGLLWVPSPEVLLPGYFQLSFQGLGHADWTDLGWTSHIPMALASRSALAPGWELGLTSTSRYWTNAYWDSWYGSISLKRGLDSPAPGWKWALQAGGSYGTYLQNPTSPPPTDFLTTFTGFHLSLPVQRTWGRLSLFLTPELDWSLYHPAYQLDESTGPAQSAWGYLRWGLVVDEKTWNFGLSGALRSRPFSQGWGLLLPLNLGLESSIHLGDSPFFLSGLVALEWASPTDYAIYAGVGVGLLLDFQELVFP